MRRKMKAVRIFFIVIFLASFFYPAFASGASIDSYLIAKSDSEKYNSICFDRDRVVWVEYGGGPGNGPGSWPRSIYRYSVATGKKDLVIADTSWKRDLDVSGDRYAWSDGRGIFVYDEGDHRLLLLYSSRAQYDPRIEGNVVLWEERDDDTSRLVVYDLVSGEHRTVVSTADRLDHPAISGDRLVYCEGRVGDHRVMLENLTTGERTVLCAGPEWHAMTAIDGDIVVWVDMRDGPYQVYFYDLGTGESGPVDPSGAYQMYPEVSGDLIVWEDYRNCSRLLPGTIEEYGDVRLYDLRSNTSRVIAEARPGMQFPKVSGGFVVWSEGCDSSHDIFLYNYSGERTDLPAGGVRGDYSATPTASPSRDTRVRHYSTIGRGEIEWYVLETSPGDPEILIELRWDDPSSSLSMSVVSPGGSTWRFFDPDDTITDQAIRMTVSGRAAARDVPGRWTLAVSGDEVDGRVPYDICWY